MRPTDENQHSIRPNLMSSPRRGGNEASILEMLERDTVRTRGLRAQSRFAWYVSGSVLAVFLVSLLVWLARESPKVQQAEAVLAAVDVDRPAAAHTFADTGVAEEAPAMAHARIAATATTAAANRAAIIDERRPSSRKQDVHQHLPPIMLATPGLLGAVPPTQSTIGAVVQDEVPDMVNAQQSTNRTNGDAGRGLASSARPRPTNKAQSASVHTSLRKPAHNTGKAKRLAAPSANAKDTQDSDVALISAVIQHTSSRPDPACADAECAPNATPKP